MKLRFDDDFYELEEKPRVIQKNRNELTPEQIQEKAKDLLNKKVDYKKIFGYVTELNSQPCNVKWDKDSEVCVYYNQVDKKQNIIKCLVKSFRAYNSDKSIEYFDEI